ncbi:MAG: DUF3194 domain-containing protein [Candidatus Odinarchaeota archaeon]|nr:DUF3194 domain-containing protein [Candidatus Odinarchaeota archaeon]
MLVVEKTYETDREPYTFKNLEGIRMKREVTVINLRRIPEDFLVELSELAEEVVRNYVTSKLGKGKIEDIEITVETEYDDELSVSIEVFVDVPIGLENKANIVIEEAIDRAYSVIEEKLESFKIDKETKEDKDVGEKS